MRVAVYGLWHLGSVTATCLAEAGHDVIGIDADADLVTGLRQGRPPLSEPGLEQLLHAQMARGRLTLSTPSADALGGIDVLWITFDTPIDDQDQADIAWVEARLDAIRDLIPSGTWVLISSQVPVGFTRRLGQRWHGRCLHYAYSPENLRLGKALESFRNPERVVIGVDSSDDRAPLTDLFAPFCSNIEWMSVESAEMTKHALNAFLATSVAFINELARLCEAVGADAKQVERGLKSEGRIGPRAYLSPGGAFAGGTLARDLQFLVGQGLAHRLSTPLLSGVLRSNDTHKMWMQSQVERLIRHTPSAVVAVLGLTYKPGTSTLRRSAAVELCRAIHRPGVRIQAHDPVIQEPLSDLAGLVDLKPEPLMALDGADVAVIATPWPQYRTLQAADICSRMRQPCIIDPNYHVAAELGDDPSITYIATGKAA
jgi:UDPglucose 6-dehydrogenase